MRCEYPGCKRRHFLPLNGVFLCEDHFCIQKDILDRMKFDPCRPFLKELITAYREGIERGTCDEMDMYSAVMKYIYGKSEYKHDQAVSEER